MRRGRAWAFGAVASALFCAWCERDAWAGKREDVAKHYAPVIFQETNDPIKDLLTAFDFDGNWNGDDNRENMLCWSDSSQCASADNPSGACASQKCPLVATMYFTVIETGSHWFVQYMPYHPLDWKLTNGHENDTESILAVVAKDGSAFGKLVAMETRFHDVWYQYSNDPGVTDGADNVDGPVHFDTTSGRPAVNQQMVGHGICGGFSPPNRAFPDLQLTCNHSDAPHIDQTGVVYSPDLPATMPTVVSNQTVKAGYTMVELLTSVWPHIHEIGAGKAFQNTMDFTGERCNVLQCPKQFGGNWEGNEGTSPGEPWAQVGGNGVSADGDQFFDPAYTMSKRFTFAGTFSLDYCHNPYVGIVGQCADDHMPDAGASDDASAGADSGVSVGDGADAGAGTGPGDDAGASANSDAPAQSSGCACAFAGERTSVPPVTGTLVGLTWLVLRRRRTRPGRS